MAVPQKNETPARWTAEKANEWYAKQPWLVGSNYTPATASNELEMWQAETFDPKRMDLELGWRVDWAEHDAGVFARFAVEAGCGGIFEADRRISGHCSEASHSPVLVLFDSVWDPTRSLGRKLRRGRECTIRAGCKAGSEGAGDRAEYPRLEATCAEWWENSGTTNGFWRGRMERTGQYECGNYTDPKDKVERVNELLPKVFAWAREAGAQQPLTSGCGRKLVRPAKLGATEKIQLEESDVISFHNYDKAEEFEKRILCCSHWGGR